MALRFDSLQPKAPPFPLGQPQQTPAFAGFSVRIVGALRIDPVKAVKLNLFARREERGFPLPPAVTPISASVLSTRADFIWLATVRFQIRS